ncbi:hypothetical protein PMAYCL1PPCAC_12628, partial [Pristionchus mayeri]
WTTECFDTTTNINISSVSFDASVGEMTTSMADPLDFGEHHPALLRNGGVPSSTSSSTVMMGGGPPPSLLLEQRAFNSGHLGAKTLPTQTGMGVCTPGSSSTGGSDVVIDSSTGYSAAAAGQSYGNHYANPYHSYHGGHMNQQASTSSVLHSQSLPHSMQPGGGFMRVHPHPQASSMHPLQEMQQHHLEQQMAAAAAGMGEPMNAHMQGDSSVEAPIDRVVFAAPAGGANEYSNLSSAGSISDKEQPETPGRASNSRPAAEKKGARKRRKGEETPRAEKKITDFIRSSPKRSRVGSNASSFVNGDGLGHALEENNHNHWPSSGVHLTASSPSRVTPTPHSSSDSNSSPPTSRDGFCLPSRMDEETQTDLPDSRVDAATMNDEITKRDRMIDDLRRQNDELQKMLIDKKRRLDTCKDTIRKLLIDQNKLERKALLEKSTTDNPRIGCYKLQRQGDVFKETWVEGFASEELKGRMDRINEQRAEIASETQLLKKRKPASKETKTSRSLTAQMNALAEGKPSLSDSSRGISSMISSAPGCSSSNNDDGFTRPELPLPPLTLTEYQEQEEIYRLRKEHLKKEEAEILVEKDKLERERQLHIREYKRSNNERDSRYKDHQTLNNRYVLLSLLGKGGFSEVWKAFDLEENRYVACKIHHVNKEWKEEKKANYVKHAMREKDIHRTLMHDRIVKLFDLFTIDNHSFCTVLEYCGGNDLDFVLKQNKQISEKEARLVVKQMVSALKYLAERKPPVIHYDLKPANILLENGNASGAIKITDFGLSKLMEDSEDVDSIELTSQFAGTYWYLPPETFVVGHSPPMISPKVDVWSVGVILYQCIYGKRPFGHEQTQQKILEEKTIIKAKMPEFPPKPIISTSAKDFICRCLQYLKGDRADVYELEKHEFLMFGARAEKRIAPASPASRMNKLESVEE